MSLDAGSSILTAGVEPGAGQAGNPADAGGAPVPGSAAATVQAVQDGPPEYIPTKFWDAERKTAKIEDMGRSYQSLEKLLGREKVPVPAGDDDEEGWQRWYAATGRPEKPDDYELERPTQTAIEYDEDGEKAFRTWAHQNGLNKRQTKNLYDNYVKSRIEAHANYTKLQDEGKVQAQHALQREYGSRYDAKLQLAKAALQQFADPDYVKYLDETGLGNDPRTIRAWVKIGEERLGETRLKGTAPQAPNHSDLDRSIADFMRKNTAALFDKAHPQHDWAVKERQKLFDARYPDAVT